MKIEYFFVCDDIRYELGNKHSIIGLYDDKIIFNVTSDQKDTWPKTMQLGVFSRINMEDDRPQSVDFKIKYNEKEKLLGKGLAMAKKQHRVDKVLTFAILFHSFLFDEPGRIKFILDFFDDDKNLICSLSPDLELKVSEAVANQ